MTLGQRVNKVLARMLMQQHSAAVDHTRMRISHGSGGHGTHGERGGVPSGESLPDVVRWSAAFECLIEKAEQEADAYTHGSRDTVERLQAGLKPASRKRDKYREVADRSPQYEGFDPVTVAFLEDCSVDLVRKVRTDLKRHRQTGERLQRGERPLTVHPRETLASLDVAAVEEKS